MTTPVLSKPVRERKSTLVDLYKKVKDIKVYSKTVFGQFWKKGLDEEINSLATGIYQGALKYGLDDTDTSKLIFYQATGYLHAYAEVKSKLVFHYVTIPDSICTTCNYRKQVEESGYLEMCKECLDHFYD